MFLRKAVFRVCGKRFSNRSRQTAGSSTNPLKASTSPHAAARWRVRKQRKREPLFSLDHLSEATMKQSASARTVVEDQFFCWAARWWRGALSLGLFCCLLPLARGDDAAPGASKAADACAIL